MWGNVIETYQVIIQRRTSQLSTLRNVGRYSCLTEHRTSKCISWNNQLNDPYISAILNIFKLQENKSLFSDSLNISLEPKAPTSTCRLDGDHSTPINEHRGPTTF